MFSISKSERQLIESKFPKAEIVATRHHAFLIGRDVDSAVRFLYGLRGWESPPSRREREQYGERLGDRFGHLFSDHLPRHRR